MRVSIFRQRNDARVTAACARGGVRFRVPRIACWPREEMIASLLWFVGKDVKSARRLFSYDSKEDAANRFTTVVRAPQADPGLQCEMPCGTVWSGWIGFGSVRSAMSMRILNVGGSAGQPPLVFLTRMPGIRAAHPLLFPFSPPSHHNSQAFLPPSPSYRFPPYRSRVPSCSTIDRLLHVYVSPFSLSSIANSVSESVSKNHFFFFCLLDQSFHPYFSCVFPRAMDRLYLEMIFYYRYHD